LSLDGFVLFFGGGLLDCRRERRKDTHA
jgi:hypothetical protein